MNKETNKGFGLTDGEVILLLELESLCNLKADGIKGMEWTIASKEYLQKKLTMSKPTMYRSLKRLEERELILRKEISYRGYTVKAISVNKNLIKKVLKATEEREVSAKDRFVKLPYLYLKAFKS